MKIEFIKRGAATRLILLFAGWSTDTRYYSGCDVDGWDIAVVSDYRDMSMLVLPPQYDTVYIFAYSLGVWAASQCNLKAAARIAVCGSGLPVSDEYGIPVSVYNATADGLTAESLKKFHRRMAGDRATLKRIESILPESPDIETLKEELYAIADYQQKATSAPELKWDKVYIAKQDRIFPEDNLDRYWNDYPGVEKIKVDSSHAIDICQIIKDVLPNPASIGEGFSLATDTYKENAIVQYEICKRIGEIVSRKLSERNLEVRSLLEIGVGRGLLTAVWQNLVAPAHATYVDLLAMPKFGIAEDENYVVGDAEEWLKKSNEKYDLILSASAIQWFADPVGFIQTVKEHLNPGGFAVVSTFVKGNLFELDAIRPCPIIYKAADDYKAIPDVETEEWESTLRFPSARAMMMHLRLTGVSPRRKASSVALTCLPKELTYRPLILVIDKK